MARYEHKAFQNETVALDGNEYVNCSFTNCVLTYAGTGDVHYDNCQMEKYQFQFVGPAARTVALLTTMRRDNAFGSMVVDVLNSIDGGVLLKSSSEGKPS